MRHPPSSSSSLVFLVLNGLSTSVSADGRFDGGVINIAGIACTAFDEELPGQKAALSAGTLSVSSLALMFTTIAV